MIYTILLVLAVIYLILRTFFISRNYDKLNLSYLNLVKENEKLESYIYDFKNEIKKLDDELLKKYSVIEKLKGDKERLENDVTEYSKTISSNLDGYKKNLSELKNQSNIENLIKLKNENSELLGTCKMLKRANLELKNCGNDILPMIEKG